MYWFAAKGRVGRILALMVAVIVGVVMFFVLGTPSVVMALSGTGTLAEASGRKALAYYAWMVYFQLAEAVASGTILSHILPS